MVLVRRVFLLLLLLRVPIRLLPEFLYFFLSVWRDRPREAWTSLSVSHRSIHISFRIHSVKYDNDRITTCSIDFVLIVLRVRDLMKRMRLCGTNPLIKSNTFIVLC